MTTLTYELDLSHDQQLENFRRTLAELRTVYQLNRFDDFRAVPEYGSYLTKAINTIGGAYELSKRASPADGKFVSGVLNEFNEWLLWELSEHSHWSSEFSEVLSLEW